MRAGNNPLLFFCANFNSSGYFLHSLNHIPTKNKLINHLKVAHDTNLVYMVCMLSLLD